MTRARAAARRTAGSDLASWRTSPGACSSVAAVAGSAGASRFLSNHPIATHQIAQSCAVRPHENEHEHGRVPRVRAHVDAMVDVPPGSSCAGAEAAGPSAPAAAEPAPAAARASSRKRKQPAESGRFQRELPGMMFGFGDSEEPMLESVQLMGEMVFDYTQLVLQQAVQASAARQRARGGVARIGERDLQFTLRKDRVRYRRIQDLLEARAPDAARAPRAALIPRTGFRRCTRSSKRRAGRRSRRSTTTLRRPRARADARRAAPLGSNRGRVSLDLSVKYEPRAYG